jgi:hypothetical protein
MFFNIKKLGHDIPAHKRNLQRERLVVFSSALAVFRTAMSTFSLARNIAQSDLSEFLLVKFLSNVSNVGKQCLKCPLHFSIIILSEKMVLASSSCRRALGRSSCVGGSWRRELLGPGGAAWFGSCGAARRVNWRRGPLLAGAPRSSWRRGLQRGGGTSEVRGGGAPGARAGTGPRVTVGDRRRKQENNSEE